MQNKSLLEFGPVIEDCLPRLEAFAKGRCAVSISGSLGKGTSIINPMWISDCAVTKSRVALNFRSRKNGNLTAAGLTTGAAGDRH